MPRPMKHQVERPSHCPRCGDGRIVSVGHPRSASAHRWRCKGCRRGFSAHTPDTTQPDSLGLYLRGLRGKKGLRVREVARAIQVSDSHVTYIELGRVRPSRKVLDRFAEFLEADPNLVVQFWEQFTRPSGPGDSFREERSFDGS
jgi:transposase-like protein